MKKIVIVMGINAGGKTTWVSQFTDAGYLRLNRDLEGGNLDGLALKAAACFAKGTENIVLDNTYASIQSRKSIIDLAKKVGASIECYWITTSLEEAQINVCRRFMGKYGRIPLPEEFKGLRHDPNAFPPIAQYQYRQRFEKPTTAEGFDKVVEIPFVRHWGPEYVNKAVIFDYDGTLRDAAAPDGYPIDVSKVKVKPEMINVVKEFQAKGFILLGASNQSGIAKGKITHEIAQACFEETNRQLGVKIDYSYCPHRVPPVSCYCRKPNPGMGVAFIEKYKLLPSKCVMIGDWHTDEGFAKRCGFVFQNVSGLLGA